MRPNFIAKIFKGRKESATRLMAITPPRTGERTLLGSIAVPEPFSLEIAGDSGEVTLPATGQEGDFVRQQLGVHYPQARVNEVPAEDDPLRLRGGDQAWSIDLRLRGPEYLPLRTFRDDDLLDQGSDPLISVIGSLSDLEEGERVVRIAAMYALVLCVSLIARFERVRRQAAVEGERRLQQERIELSHSIHDTTAQSAYMIGLGIDAAKKLAGDSNEELAARLEATSRLSKTAIWQLRHPIDMGRIFDGRELGGVLESHVATFTSVTSVAAELTQNGVEPPLSIEAKSVLFTIAHNALTNAFRHAGASRVLVGLDFGEHELRLSVSDDGVGLPGDYEERGHGFANMRADAERLGGRLVVEPRGPDGGASVACVMPLGRRGQEG